MKHVETHVFTAQMWGFLKMTIQPMLGANRFGIQNHQFRYPVRKSWDVCEITLIPPPIHGLILDLGIETI